MANWFRVYIPIPLYGEKNGSVRYWEDLNITIRAYNSMCIISEDKKDQEDPSSLYFFIFFSAIKILK